MVYPRIHRIVNPLKCNRKGRRTMTNFPASRNDGPRGPFSFGFTRNETTIVVERADIATRGSFCHPRTFAAHIFQCSSFSGGSGPRFGNVPRDVVRINGGANGRRDRIAFVWIVFEKIQEEIKASEVFE